MVSFEASRESGLKRLSLDAEYLPKLAKQTASRMRDQIPACPFEKAGFMGMELESIKKAFAAMRSAWGQLANPQFLIDLSQEHSFGMSFKRIRSFGLGQIANSPTANNSKRALRRCKSRKSKRNKRKIKNRTAYR